MKYIGLTLVLFVNLLFTNLLYPNLCFAEKSTDSTANSPPHQPKEEKFIDPNDVDGEGYIDPYDEGLIDGKGVDPNDFKLESEDRREEKQEEAPSSLDGLYAGSSELYDESAEFFSDANKSWASWRKLHFQSPKPPLEWKQVGLELGAGYAGAFGGSVLGVFSGFLVGSLYEAVSDCDQCWVDVAANLSTLGATLGVSAGVYVLGNTEKQMGSLFSTYVGAVIPVIIGAFAFNDASQISRSGFYLLTMPLTATLGFNLSRHYRQEGEKPYFDYFSADDMWVSKGRGDTLALNLRWKF